jgi:ribosomal protein S18 acetylase RimI-like enzyme
MLIRTATELDWPSIWPFWHEIVAAGDTYTYDGVTDAEQARELWFGSGRYQTWVCIIDSSDRSDPSPSARDSGRIVGTYHLGPNHAGPGSHIANASYMVASGTRGHGIGRAMVEHSIVRATESGYLGIQFNAVAASNTYAIRLYTDLGFDIIGRVPGGFRHPQQGLIDLLIMYRAL